MAVSISFEWKDTTATQYLTLDRAYLQECTHYGAIGLMNNPFLNDLRDIKPRLNKEMTARCTDYREFYNLFRNLTRSSASSKSTTNGRDIRPYLMDTITAISRCEEVVLMCDGKQWPFDPSSSDAIDSTPSAFVSEEWKEFRDRFPDKSFHFIAIGKQ